MSKYSKCSQIASWIGTDSAVIWPHNGNPILPSGHLAKGRILRRLCLSRVTEKNSLPHSCIRPRELHIGCDVDGKTLAVLAIVDVPDGREKLGDGTIVFEVEDKVTYT